MLIAEEVRRMQISPLALLPDSSITSTYHSSITFSRAASSDVCDLIV